MLRFFRKMRNVLIPESQPDHLTSRFGEIPIKSLQRYPAIIQGFIGWFMLTILVFH